MPKISRYWKFVWSRTTYFIIGYYIVTAFVAGSLDISKWVWFDIGPRVGFCIICALTFGIINIIATDKGL